MPLYTDSYSNSQHNRDRSSLTPLNVPNSVSTPGPSLTSVSSRPSTANSMLPLRPPSRQSQTQASHQFQQQAAVGRTSSHTHSQSSSSVTGPPLSHSVWTPSAGPTHHTASSSDFGSTEFPFYNRAGSPVSIQEQRRLQVANAIPGVGSPTASVYSPEPNDSFQLVDTSTPSAVGVFAAAATSEQRDGKGRLKQVSEKPPLVHLDGGRYQEGQASSSSSAPAGPLPPAYDA